jgi:hypothetical protein
MSIKKITTIIPRFNYNFNDLRDSRTNFSPTQNLRRAKYIFVLPIQNEQRCAAIAAPYIQTWIILICMRKDN